MARIDDLLVAAVKAAGPKPDDSATKGKGPWSNKLSARLASAVAQELRERGMGGTRPAGSGEVGAGSGAERRLGGGIGAKKVDVTWATEESGLMFACSIKTIMFRDEAPKNFQKNLTNRRGDLLFESTTLHRRFPYAVVAGFFFDHQAATDGTKSRNNTFDNAFPRLRLFTRRADPSDREEQFERLYQLLVDSNQFAPKITCYEVNDRHTEVDLATAFDEIVELAAERNFDTYEAVGDGTIRKIRRAPGED